MSQMIQFTIDGVEVTGQTGQTIMQAADAAGIYIPRLCFLKGLSPYGACRVCTVMVNGRPQTACTQPIANDMVVENDTAALLEVRRSIVEMLYVEGNHFCMFCEVSGKCELQALGYRFKMMVPKYPFQYPDREIDASHPDLFIDRSRCVLCARCIRSSKELDGKNAYGFVGRGPSKKIAFNSAEGLAGTEASVDDKAAEACPVGTILKKDTAFRVPYGQRKYDAQPIGSEIEATKPQ
ncbi:MAG: 2Fe-2S iron-sulfur cluster-binding protein [Planctomycetaceae bacterium]|nr:2Fe-2S iron-sulfur cluster-binding protein [Planctomycetaceae bacterium]